MSFKIGPLWSETCSICDFPNVYFCDSKSIEEEVVSCETGRVIVDLKGNPMRMTKIFVRCYCKDCFEDCGGKDYVERLGYYPRAT